MLSQRCTFAVICKCNLAAELGESNLAVIKRHIRRPILLAFRSAPPRGSKKDKRFRLQLPVRGRSVPSHPLFKTPHQVSGGLMSVWLAAFCFPVEDVLLLSARDSCRLAGLELAKRGGVVCAVDRGAKMADGVHPIHNEIRTTRRSIRQYPRSISLDTFVC